MDDASSMYITRAYEHILRIHPQYDVLCRVTCQPKRHKQWEGARSAPISIDQMAFLQQMIGAYFLFLVPPIFGTTETPQVSGINFFSKRIYCMDVF